MVEEIFDVVDAQDNVQGAFGRQEVHAKGLFHRAVHILVRGEDGRILVQRRGFNKDCSPGLWDTSAGGHVASGEEYQSAASRELLEELGINCGGQLEFLFKLPAGVATGQEFVCVYQGVTAEVPYLQESEVAAARWVSREELNAWIKRDRSQFTPVFLKICEEVGLI
ncbi:MAG: NUDIX domain-containing protein [Pseudomonadota bacterium]